MNTGRLSIVWLISLFCVHPVGAQRSQVPPFYKINWSWVDSVYRGLSEEQRIAQLIMVPAWSNRGPEHQLELERTIQRYGIGGICFFQGGPVRQATMINRFQEITKVPLLMAIDAEWGLAMRLDSTPAFPFQMALGAIRDNHLIYRMGREIGRALHESGIQVNFAPVLDVNNNPENPVINYRSFGENPSLVADKGISYMNGLQDVKILATGKHFPGHGDTDTDSHLALPSIYKTGKELRDLELIPFKRAIDAGLGSIMVAHLDVPSLEPIRGLPTTLSVRVIDSLLRKTLLFSGLIVTDALNMKGVTNQFPPGEIEVKALLAGNDVLVYVEDVALAISKIKMAILDGTVKSSDIETRCKRVLAAKYWTGLHQWKPIDSRGLTDRINTDESEVLNWELTKASLTVLRNERNLIPLTRTDTLRIASLSIGTSATTTFQSRLDHYEKITRFQIESKASPDQFKVLGAKLQPFDIVLIGIHHTDQRAVRSFGLEAAEVDFLSKMAQRRGVILSYFGNPYAMAKIPGVEMMDGLIIAYQESLLAEDLTAQLIFGGIGASGRLPVSVGTHFPTGAGMDTDGGTRFSYSPAGVVNMDAGFILRQIDSIALAGIHARAYPGCEVLCARDGHVFFHHCYGFHTYDSLMPVIADDLFDMASVTKVSAPLPLLMQLYQEGLLDLDKPMGDYWPDFRTRSKRDMVVREVLAHYGKLYAWIPFWRDTKRQNGKFRWLTFQEDSSDTYPIRVSQNLWIHKNYANKIYRSIKQSPVSEEHKYVYSDLGFILWPKVIERITGEDYQERLQRDVYRPLGAYTLGYNPLQHYHPDRIIPTERDTFFRMEILHGYVHDEGAAMLGGVSGHAGLFGTAEDLAKLWQMYLWQGSYAGHQFINPMVLSEFTRYQYANEGIRRGLGFDKPVIGNAKLPPSEAYPAHSASPLSFGHSGYTGTFVWVDPETGLLFVFLSNRVYPTRDNSRLSDMNIRTSILQTLYDGIR